MSSIYVTIPRKDGELSLFAEGKLLSKIKVPEGFLLEFPQNKCIILFYKVNYRQRRLYVVCNPEQMKNIGVYTFEKVNTPMSIVTELRGRGFDEFKRSLEYIKKATNNLVYDMPPVFWWQYGFICKNQKNNRVNLNLLLQKYNLEIKKVRWS